MRTALQSSWDRAWLGLDAQGAGHAIRDAVVAHYSEPHRRYHTLQHLDECLSMFERVREAADHPHEVEMALWFHDAIHNLKASDNEEQSANWAKTMLIGADVPLASASRVHDLILKTKHTGLPESRDEQVLVDIDLSILGSTSERFAEYERQIREEYSHVPGFLFRLKRRSILKSFLERPALFRTPELHRELEARARYNLASAIA